MLLTSCGLVADDQAGPGPAVERSDREAVDPSTITRRTVPLPEVSEEDLPTSSIVPAQPKVALPAIDVPPTEGQAISGSPFCRAAQDIGLAVRDLFSLTQENPPEHHAAVYHALLAAFSAALESAPSNIRGPLERVIAEMQSWVERQESDADIQSGIYMFVQRSRDMIEPVIGPSLTACPELSQAT